MSDATAKATSTLKTVDLFTASVPDWNITTTGDTVTLAQAHDTLSTLVAAASSRHERTAIVGPDGTRRALIIHPEDWDNLTDAFALAHAALTDISGQRDTPVSHDDAKRAVFGDIAPRDDRPATG